MYASRCQRTVYLCQRRLTAIVLGMASLVATFASESARAQPALRGTLRAIAQPRTVNLAPTTDQRLAQAPAADDRAVPSVNSSRAPAVAPNSGPRSQTNNDGFDDDQRRLPLLGEPAPGLGTVPRPSDETQRTFSQFIERTIDPESTLELIQSRPRLLVFRQPPVRVQVADETIANYDLITEREFSIVGHELGATVLNFWFTDPTDPRREKILSYLVRVSPSPEDKVRLEIVYQGLEQEINRDFPNSHVQLSLVGDSLVVRGEARDIVEAQQILQILGRNAPGAERQLRRERLRNAITQAADTSGLSDQQRISLLDEAVDATRNTTGNVTIVGNPNDIASAAATNAQNALTNQTNLNNLRIVNLLRVPGEHQVMLRVTVAEMNRNAARSIGLNMTFNNGNGVNVFQSLAGAATIGAGNLPTLLDNGQVNLAIRALRNLSLARSLAEPNLVTTNGQPASFLAGGEFPVPSGVVGFGSAAQGVAFVPFGVQLQFTPYITDRDRIRLVARATVSTRDAALGATINGTTVSGLNSRTFTSTVELRDGQTLAVGGLIQNNFGSVSERVPLWGDLPIIGALGGSRSTTSAEQELVILITPELVHPLEACQTPPVPGADVFEPGDVEFFLLGRLESRRSVDFRASARTDWARMRSYETCNDRFIIGARGRTYGCCDPGGRGCPTPAGTNKSSPPSIVIPPSESIPVPDRAGAEGVQMSYANPIASSLQYRPGTSPPRESLMPASPFSRTSP